MTTGNQSSPARHDPSAALRDHPEGCTIALRAQPGARKTAFLGLSADGAQWRVAVAAPPVEGRANQALTRFLASHFAVSRASIRQISGEHARDKVFLLRGLTRAAAAALLPAMKS